jgi:hypothetical protein
VRGDTLVHVDGHGKPEYGAIGRLVRCVEQVTAPAVVTPAIAALRVPCWQNDLSQVGNGYSLDLRTFECGWLPLSGMRLISEGGLQFYESPALIGCAMVVSRELYDKLRGFDAHMSTELARAAPGASTVDPASEPSPG